MCSIGGRRSNYEVNVMTARKGGRNSGCEILGGEGFLFHCWLTFSQLLLVACEAAFIFAHVFLSWLLMSAAMSLQRLRDLFFFWAAVSKHSLWTSSFKRKAICQQKIKFHWYKLCSGFKSLQNWHLAELNTEFIGGIWSDLHLCGSRIFLAIAGDVKREAAQIEAS